MHRSAWLLAIPPALLAACSSSSSDDLGSLGNPDGAQAADVGGARSDAGMSGGQGDAVPSDMGVAADGGQGPIDTGVIVDAGPPPDAGMTMTPELAPGSHVTLTTARIDIGDTFSAVKTKLGPGMRSQGTGARSFEWTIAGVHLTIWFANTTLSTDMPPNDIHDTDKVLWIAVDGAAYTGKTSNGIGIGTNRNIVESPVPGGYGPTPKNVPIMAGGSIDLYYKTGFIAAYDATDHITTFTVCKAYRQAPDATLDTQGARLTFPGGAELKSTILALVGGQNGTSLADVPTVLGPPDGEGDVTIGNQQLHLLSYSFIGIEVFNSPQVPGNNVLFSSVHAPYYGSFMGSAGVGVGSARADVEAALPNNPQPMNSAGTPGLVCYDLGNSRIVGVTYTTTAPIVASSISVVLPSCP